MTGKVLIYGGPILTMDDGCPSVEAVLIADGRIVAVGSLDELRRQSSVGTPAGDSIEVDLIEIDLKDQILLPGFIDAHSHILWAAKTRGAPVVDVRAITVPTYRALLAKVRRQVAAARPGEFLLFFGLDAQLHPDMEHPGRQLLDEIAPQNPIGIQTSNCHALYLNSAGFEACGIDEHFQTPTGSVIDRDEQGVPTGRIAEAITWRALETFYEAWGDDRLSEQFHALINDFIQCGITTVTEHLYLPYYETYYRAALKQALPLPRVAAYQQVTTADMHVEPLTLGDDRLWMAGVKIHADGSPFIGNIWVTTPYLSTPMTLERMQLREGHTGSTNYPQAFFEEMLRTYFAQGWQMSVHTQGDATIDMVLDLVEQILQETPRDDHRFRLEHCALMRQDQIDRAMKLGVLSSFFINHITHWGAPIEDALFGPERAAHYMPAGSATKAGMPISLHADTPMTDPSALALMQAATTREAGDGRCLGPDECLDAMTALRSVTIDAAFQIGMEDKLGSITPGKHADLVILDSNPLSIAADKLTNIKVVQTWLAGECVWTRA